MREEAEEAAAVDPEAGAASARLDELWSIMQREQEEIATFYLSASRQRKYQVVHTLGIYICRTWPVV